MKVYDFAIGQTNPETFPVEEFKAAAVRAIENEHEMFNKYPGNMGHQRLRELMAQRETEREGVEVSADQISITNGSMQSVTMVGQAMMSGENDIVLTEEFTYTGTISAYKGIGLEIVGVAMDEDGMRMDDLRAKLKTLYEKGTPPKFIYTLTTYQNPTGTIMPRSRKEELISIAGEYDLPLVEDNCYGDVHFEGEKVPSIYAMDDNPNHIYICSLSKILAPGVRLGYLLARDSMLEKIVKQRNDAGSNYFASAVVAEFYKNGIWEHCDRSNPVLKHKRDLVDQGLSEHMSDIGIWSKPVGGLFMWLRIPEDVDMQKLLSTANEKGVFFAPGAAFHFNYESVPYIRLAFGHVPDELIKEGIPILARCIKECRTSNEAVNFTSLF